MPVFCLALQLCLIVSAVCFWFVRLLVFFIQISAKALVTIDLWVNE